MARQSTATLDPLDYDCMEDDAVLKTTTGGKLVIQTAYRHAKLWKIGEIARLGEQSTRLFRIDGKGQVFANGYLSSERKREQYGQQYLYVTELTAAAPTSGCALCGAGGELLTSPRGLVCPDCFDRAEG